MSQIPMFQIPRVAVTGADHFGSRPTDKHAHRHVTKHVNAAVCKIAANIDSSADSVDSIAQAHRAAGSPGLAATSPVKSSSPHYKIAGEFLKAGIRNLPENQLDRNHLRANPIAKMRRSATDPSETDIILHLLDSPALRLGLNGKLSSWNGVDAGCERIVAENQRSTIPDAINDSLQGQSGVTLMQPGQRQALQSLTAANRGRA